MKKIYQPALREALVARRGKVLCSIDYDAGEMVTWAQACTTLVGTSRLAEVLNARVDPHCALGAKVMRLPYEEYYQRYKAGERQIVDNRQSQKPPNFTFPGGGGAPTVTMTQRVQGQDTPCEQGNVWLVGEKGELVRGYRGLRFCVLAGAPRCGAHGMVREWKRRKVAPVCADCLDEVVMLRREWGEMWPESVPYFGRVAEDLERGYVVQLGSGRVRAVEGYSQCANSYFQELLAHITKRAFSRIVRECTDRSRESVLYGARSPGFFHDELILELEWDDADRGRAQAARASDVMVQTMREFCPDLAPAANAEPALMARWDKRAKPVRDAAGLLQVWRPPGDDPYAPRV